LLAHAGIAIRSQAIPPAQRDEQLSDHGSAKLKRISTDCSRFSAGRSRAQIRSAAAPAAAFSPAVAAPANSASSCAACRGARLYRSSHRQPSLRWITRGGKSIAHAIIRGANAGGASTSKAPTTRLRFASAWRRSRAPAGGRRHRAKRADSIVAT
jgi:hypothetical protein